MPPNSPKLYDVWVNTTGYSVGPLNPGETGVWCGSTWVPTFGRDPKTIRTVETKRG